MKGCSGKLFNSVCIFCFGGTTIIFVICSEGGSRSQIQRGSLKVIEREEQVEQQFRNDRNYV